MDNCKLLTLWSALVDDFRTFLFFADSTQDDAKAVVGVVSGLPTIHSKKAKIEAFVTIWQA